MDNWHLLKQVSPATADKWIVAEWDSKTHAFKALYFYTSEDAARATCHRMEHGFDE
jgi:hypothetical protein